MPKYTDEQIERAKNVDVRTFLEQTEGYTFVQSGKYLKCKDPERTGQPSSLTVDTKLNRIFYNSATGNRPLSALDWCKEVRKMDFQSSMSLIIGENPQGERVEKPKFTPFKPKEHTEETEKKDFVLPDKTDSTKHVYSYLTASRGIPQHIVQSCIKNGLIMEDTRRNAVFVGYDENNEAKYAARRGTFTFDGAEPFKRDVSGSDKNFAFKLVGKDTETIYVTEAAIDALSLAAIEDKFNGEWSFKNKTYISTGGAGIDNAIEQFCKTHNVKTINICFDNDEAGKNGMEKIMKKFREMGYTVNDMRASLAHDYNDELLEFNKNPQFYSEPPITVKKNEPVETAEQGISEQTLQETQKSPLKPLENETANNTNNNANAVQTAHEAVTEPYEDNVTDYTEDSSTTAKTAQETSVTAFSEEMNDLPEVNVSDSLQNAQESHTEPSEDNVTDYTEDSSTTAKTAQETSVTALPEERNENNMPEVNISDNRQKDDEREAEQASEALAEQSANSAVPDMEKQSQYMSTEEKMNFLLSTVKERQESKRADLLDKIDSIDNKISERQAKIVKLNDKISDIEASLKTSAALKRVFGNTALGSLIDRSIEKKEAKIERIKSEKIPAQQAKIEKQQAKRDKAVNRLGKVNKKIDRIDKLHSFITAIGSKDREVRHQGFVNGLENLSEIRRESLESKANKIDGKIGVLTDKYNSAPTHKERLDIGKEINSLRVKLNDITSKIQGMDKLNQDLSDIRNGKFTAEELERTVANTSDKISARLDNSAEIDNGNIIDHVIEQTVEAGNEAISETTAEKAVEQSDRVNPDINRERVPEDREPDVNKNTELDILTMAAVITGVDVSELNRLPAEIKADIIAEFQENNGNISTEQLAERICNIADIEPPEVIQPTAPEAVQEERKEKENPLRELEEMLEENYNYIDGILNNLPPEKPKEQEAAKKDTPLFSRSSVMSDDFKPTSSKSQEDIERDKQKSKKHNVEI